MFIRSEARYAKFHTRDRPGSMGNPITKGFTAQFPLPPPPWSNFKPLECLEAPGHKPRDNAFRASDRQPSRNEAGGRTRETY